MIFGQVGADMARKIIPQRVKSILVAERFKKFLVTWHMARK